MKIILLILISLKINAQTLPNAKAVQEDKILPTVVDQDSKKIPGDDVIPNISLTTIADKLKSSITSSEKNSIETIKENQEKYMKTQRSLRREKSKVPAKKILVIGDEGEARTVSVDSLNQTKQPDPVQPQPPILEDNVALTQAAPKAPSFEDRTDGIRIFTRNINNYQGRTSDTISLPSGSTAKGIMLGGVEVTNEERSVDVKLESLFLGPNNAQVEMDGCVVWIKLRANFNNERLYGKGYSISCRADSGKTFEIPILAHVKGKDAYLGIKGEMIANGKGAAGALGFAKDLVGGYGEALAKTQTSTNVVASGGDFGQTASAENVTGSDSKYIAGKVASSVANNRFLNWYLDYYTSLSPTIAVPPGEEIYLSVEGEVQIPKEFFKGSKTKANTDSEFYKAKINRGEN